MSANSVEAPSRSTQNVCMCVIFSGMMSWKDPQFKQTFSCNDKSMGFNDNWVYVMNDALY